MNFKPFVAHAHISSVFMCMHMSYMYQFLACIVAISITFFCVAYKYLMRNKTSAGILYIHCFLDLSGLSFA